MQRPGYLGSLDDFWFGELGNGKGSKNKKRKHPGKHGKGKSRKHPGQKGKKHGHKGNKAKKKRKKKRKEDFKREMKLVKNAGDTLTKILSKPITREEVGPILQAQLEVSIEALQQRRAKPQLINKTRASLRALSRNLRKQYRAYPIDAEFLPPNLLGVAVQKGLI